ncbi:D-glycero-beta-D-manno-heptose-7-phosphate kinase [Desulfothermus okinawensis JCM 13304]
MLDHYQYGAVERISPEAPVPVVKIEKEEFKLGGAANVANNIKKLGGDPYLLGVVGNDRAGDVLIDLLFENKIHNTLIKIENHPTTTKTRILAKSQQLLRIDKESTSEDHSHKLLQVLHEILPTFQLVIVSDYGKGTIGKDVLLLLQNSKAKVLIDPKERNYSFYKKPFIITPNKKEAEGFSGIRITDKESLIEAGRKIIEKTECYNLLITLGKQGMVLFENQGNFVYHLPTLARKVYDVTGAGDTVLSALAYGLSKKIDIVKSCIFANICAGIVVGKMGTSFPEWDEIQSDSRIWDNQMKITLWQEQTQ